MRAHLRLNNHLDMFSQRNRLILFYLFEFEQNVRNVAVLHIQNVQPGDKMKGDFHFKTFCMKQIIKHVAGVDVAQNELVVSLGKLYDDFDIEIFAYKVFPNHLNGFKSFLNWVYKLTDTDCNVRVVMEATGVYHETFAYFLDEKSVSLSVVLPNKISNYFRTLEVKTVTDKTASEAIARFGLERKLDAWKRPKPLYKKLKQLTRERNQIISARTTAKNQSHAKNVEAEISKSSLKRLKVQIALFDKQEKEIKAEIEDLIKDAPEDVRKTVELICTIPGVGTLTAVTVLAETNDFDLIRSKAQLTSYAGLDVKEKQSGTSVKGKPRISKKGNKYLRQSMHLPALCAIRYNDRLEALYVRLVSKHGIKMKGAVAVQRKLLELIYTIYKKQEPFNPDYVDNNKEELIKETN